MALPGGVFEPASELSQHTQPGGTRDEEDASWVVANDNESVDSFLTNCPPSFMEKSWISATHDGMTKLVEEFYTSSLGEEGTWGRDSMDAVKEAWDESETKSVETLTTLLKEHNFGAGKWMIFVNASEVDALWRKVVTALWDGKLGHSAKVSGNTPESNGSHVINVFVDPFWEVKEVERVLVGLRELCGVSDAIKFKADGVSQLGLGKANEFGIPPSFYAANKNSVTVSVQKAGGKKFDSTWASKKAEGGEGGGEGGEKPAYSARSTGGNNDKWAGGRGKEWVRREAPKVKEVPKKDDKKGPAKVSAFAALSGVDDDDAEAIIAKKKEKKAKKKAKAEAAEAEAAAKSEAAFEALKAGRKESWGGMADDDEEEDTAAAEDEEDDESSSEEEEEEEEAVAAPAATPADISDPAPVAVEKPKEKTKEELEVEALMAALDEKDDAKDEGGGGGDGKLSKAAAKRAKKKAAAAGGDAAAATETPAAEATAEAGDEPENDGGNAKSAEEIKKMMAAKAAAAKKKKEGGSSGAAAAILAEAKAREAASGGKKKKGPKTWESGGGKQAGFKARGSDNKYQGE